MKKTLRLSLGLIISGVSLWFVLKGFDWKNLFIALQKAQWVWVAPAVLAYISAFIFRTLRWHVLLRPIAIVSRIKLFFVLSFGYLANNILPARGGELARAYAGSRLTKAPFSTVLGTIFVERVTDLISFACVMLIASSVIPKDFLPFGKIFKIIAILFAAGGIAIGLSLVIQKKKKSGYPKFVTKIIEIIKDFSTSWPHLKSFKTLLPLSAYTFLVWALEVIGVIILSKVFGLNFSPIQALALIVGIGIGVMLPAAPGYIGTYELFGSRILILMGFEETIATGFVLLLHAYQLILTSLFGLPYFFQIGRLPKKEELKTQGAPT